MQQRRERHISAPLGSDELLTRLAAEPPAPTTLTVVRGTTGTGKTRLLAQLHEQLRDRTVLVPEAAEAEDAAESLLVAVADAPAIRKREPELDRQITNPEAVFEEKVRWVGQALERHAEELILLGDAAASWLAKTRDHPDGNARASLFAQTILRSSCARVLTSPVNERELYGDPVIFELQPHRLDAEAYVSADWGVLTDEAHRAARQLNGHQVAPVAFRMLVMSELVGSDGPPGRVPHRAMISRLFWEMERSSDERPRNLAKAWRSLSAVRGLADEALVRDVVEPDDWTRDALRSLLADQDIDKPRLLDLFRWQGRRAQNDTHPATIAVHRRAAAHHRAFDATLRSRVELVHHLGRAFDIDALREIQPLFQEQLHDIGWFLSARLRRYRDAARVYEAAIEHDDSDARAHHYRAFNLDVAGAEPAEVQRSYKEAVRLQPDMLWWRSRFIRFLITRGRIDEARQAWDEALDATLDLEPTSVWLYEDLHLDVARALLVRNELAFARQVLEDVPEEVLCAAPELTSALDYARRLVHASPSGDYLPIWRLTADWPQRPPPLLELVRHGDRLREWWAGRVHDVDHAGGSAQLLLAKVDAARREITEEAALVLDLSLLRSRAAEDTEIEPGAYLQIGFYGDDERDPVVVHDGRPEDFLDPVLGVFPSPVRYTREYARTARRRRQLA